jgi:hypothetical protein
VAGVQIPYTTTVTAMGQEQVIRIEKLEANVSTSVAGRPRRTARGLQVFRVIVG